MSSRAKTPRVCWWPGWSRASFRPASSPSRPATLRGASAPRTLWKEITVTGLPPRPAYVQTSIVGSLTVDLDEEFAVYVPEDDQVATYAWSVPEALTVVSGGDTERVVLKANRKSVNIPANSISVTTVSRTGLSETHRFEKMICVLPTDGYPAKRYGTKTWMTVNLNYAGEDGSVGRTAPDDPDGSKYGRYYTWAEAMTLDFRRGES